MPLEHTILDASKLQYHFSLERLAGLMPPARQAPAPLKVYFYAGEDGMEAGEGGDWNKALNNPLRRLMFHNVACPMLNMFGPGDCRRFDHPFMIPEPGDHVPTKCRHRMPRISPSGSCMDYLGRSLK